MKMERYGYLALLLVTVLLISSAALNAQSNANNFAQTTPEVTAEMTAEGTQELFFSDNRINNRIVLGEFGIFCEDEQGVAASSYEGGGISVYGANGEQYIYAPEEALSQMSDMSGEMTPEATDMAMSTDEAEMTETPQTPILLGQARAAFGLAQLFLVGDNQFQLTGFLPGGSGFRYNWTGCTGTTGIDTTYRGTPQPYITTTAVPTLGAPQPTANATTTNAANTGATLVPTGTITAEATTSP